jgi:hypothetical protein
LGRRGGIIYDTERDVEQFSHCSTDDLVGCHASLAQTVGETDHGCIVTDGDDGREVNFFSYSPVADL